MNAQMTDIWRQTRNLPPNEQEFIIELFRTIEHLAQKLPENKTASSNYEFIFNTGKKSKYYQPRWFTDSGNGGVHSQ